MTTPRAQAAISQARAADPGVNAFVSASAGSGKTKVLTDRLLRLMLAGAEPGRILCLTYTRAAAAEMRIRLQRRLGEFVTMGDAALDGALEVLACAPDAAMREAARRLFGRVLDLPGGMRIDTIHGFCAALLHRFPIEAALPPGFAVLDDAEAARLLRGARDTVLRQADPALLARVAAEIPLETLDRVVAELRAAPADAVTLTDLAGLVRRQRAVLGLDPEGREEDLIAQAVAGIDPGPWQARFAVIAEGATTSQRARIAAAQAWLSAPRDGRLARFADWYRYFLKADGSAYAQASLASAATHRADPGLAAVLLAEQARLVAVHARLAAERLASFSAALLALAAPIVTGFGDAKRAQGRLDYADLVERTHALLADPGAAWVLYKLDGGLDHLLLDEVQDTAPEQWRIADALIGEFFAGEGARAVTPARSVFAVGDEKQSIYSFQGAAPDQLEFWRARWCARAEAAGLGWRDEPLGVSFRSTEPVLRLVDSVFDALCEKQRVAANWPRHLADRAEDAGSVMLWPRVVQTGNDDPAAPPPEEILAQRIAEWIAGRIAGGEKLASQNRALRAGDFLVLVRNRTGPLLPALHRHLKERGVKLAGADRVMLANQPAVADLLALCEALLLPENDLAFAVWLTSPLGGLGDPDLLRLAPGRAGTLYGALAARAAEDPRWQAALAQFRAIQARVDFVTPHALLCLVLGKHSGRRRLYARLGPQAGEAIDALLDAALEQADGQVPSLQGFVQRIREAGGAIKREAGGAGDALRIMTVHGAKGLQAPVVILVASVGLARERRRLAWVGDGGALVPLWRPRKDSRVVLPAPKGADPAPELGEHHRLLYVALTRAEDELVICGHETSQTLSHDWYEAVEAGFQRLAARDGAGGAADAAWDRELTTPQRRAVRPREVAGPEVAEPPAWLATAAGEVPAPPAEPALPASLAPSRPDGVEWGEVAASALPLAVRDAAGRRFRRGKVVHGLLQHLPALAQQARRAAAASYLRREFPPAEAETLTAEVMALLDRADLAPLFGPDSRAEVPLTGRIDTAAGPRIVGGVVDRLAILPDQVLIADYKTNRDPPTEAADIPEAYRRQLASYAAVLAPIHPDRPVHAALIWTRTGRVDWLF